MVEMSLRPLAAVLVSAVAIVLIVASYRRPNLRDSWSVAAALAKFGIVASMVPGVLAGESYRWSMGSYAPVADGPAIEFALEADALGVIFALLASLLWIFTSFYAVGYMRGLDEHAQTRFFAAFAASLAAAVGIAFAANLVTIFVFYELLSVATYPLVAHDEDGEARAAGRKYLTYTFFGGGVLVLAGTALVFVLAGTTEFGATAQALATADPVLAKAAFALLAAGFGVKAGLMPLHSWLPDAMVAPTPVSGLLHAVAVVKSGVFGIARLVLEVYSPAVVSDLGMGVLLASVAAFTILVSSLIALRQDHLKRRLAYSTVSQLSYIVLGLALLGPTAIKGGLLHIPAHAFMKLTLFFCAGFIHVETHTDYISEMDGIGKRMPLTMSAFAVAAAGMAGIPLVAGFVSKWFLLIGAVEVEQAVFAVALLLSGVLNIAYFWPIVYGAFFESPGEADSKPLLEGPLGGRFGAAADADAAPVATDGSGDDADAADASEDATASSGTYAVDRNPSDHRSEEEREQRSDADDAADGSGRDDDVDHHDVAHDDHAHGGTTGDWEAVGWTGGEGSWLMLGPILAVAAGAIVLGVVPYQAVFLQLIEQVLTEVTF
ncbi:multisubunit sodium/proton antiporter, MrpD subunit [Natronoarchaeum philippinense]|uniref:Multisubunit sodium/proton antiporter, MrpD subunit n=1 Tax=Natronoarchaeum philippinense TaxID=558529 RepID=A0A285N1G6_NATPI|nr:proton-conducting transporter membrane subunit [Natronoarchaeum philippinense]SNZ02627.1 multisubunit sodium/proton antiporter, MrpD subunit [Natronoarchaeum philippinense]